MKSLKLEINSFNNMSISDYEKIYSLKDNMTDAIDYEIELLSVLCNCSVDDILDLPIHEYQRLRNEAQFIAVFPDIKPKCPEKININGHKYVLTKDVSKITTAAYIDFQSYLKMENNTVYVLSCFLIPEGKTYNEGYNIEDVISDIKTLDIITALEICFFFISTYLNLTKGIVRYLESEIKKQMKQTKDKEIKKKMKEALKQMHSVANGVGF